MHSSRRLSGPGGHPEPGAAQGGGGRMSSLEESRREMYRRQVLTAAEHEFGRAGYGSARMEAIATTAGVSLATVYKAFNGKLDIWNALHADRMDALLATVEAATRDASSALERLLGGIATVARFLTEHDAYLDLNLRAEFAWAGNTDGGHGVQRTVWSAGLETVAAGVRAALANGELQDIRPRIAAGMIVSALQMWLADWVASGRDRMPEEVIDEMMLRLRWMLVGGTGQLP
jgi:AcrR family transcriptional regulator